MALIAEELVEEWLRKQGYFTIRGIKLGVHEVDLLAVKSQQGQIVERRHIEVQASMRPVSFISKVPKAQQKTGRAEYFSPSWTPFQADRGRDFSVIVDGDSG